MKTNIDLTGKPFHFIGIGGIGMSALAYVLAKRQLPVSGSDLRTSHITKRLEKVGAHIFNSHAASNLEFFHSSIYQPLPAIAGKPCPSFSSLTKETDILDHLPQVIWSTAINFNNSEYQAALKKDCPLFHRSDLLAALIEDYHSIAVAGTHGKTTTSSLIGSMLLSAGLDPTIIVGGEVEAWEGNAHLGNSDLLVAEADESDGSLVKHSPKIGVITNIELDHPDHYHNLSQLINTFAVFSSQCQTWVGSLDCPIISANFQPPISYSLSPDQQADYFPTEIIYHPGGSRALIWEQNQCLGVLELQIPGKHNISNAMAAIAVGRKLGLDFEVIAKALANFNGAKRRFEQKGQVNGITIIDDYAHHPSEIQATLAAAKVALNPEQHQRIVAIFQPHRYTRTQTFLEEFGSSFGDADLVVVTDIYSAGETNLGTLNGQQVADVLSKYHPQVVYHRDINSLSSFLTTILLEGDLALFLGAGNLNQVIPELININ